MRKPNNAEQRIVYRHPRGRFNVIETYGKSPFGTPFSVREAVLTPESDERGLFHGVNLSAGNHHDPAPDVAKAVAKSSPRKKPVDFLSERERIMIMDMHEIGWSVPKIASSLHKTASVVFDYIYSAKTEKAAFGDGTPQAAIKV